MISIPIAAPNKLFQWQASLFQFAQFKVYGNDAIWNSKIGIVKQNNINDARVSDVDWNLRIPYYMTGGIYDYATTKHQYNVAINLFYSLKEVIANIHHNEPICILDCDVIPLKQYTGPLPQDDEIITCNFYEDWHMKISRPDKSNYHYIEPFLKHDTHEYIDGGFVPMIIRKNTLDKIIDEVIDISLQIVDKHHNEPFGWWCAMAGLNIVCHNNHIKMISQDNCYFPHMNELTDNHYFAHYSCDPKFNKGSFPNHNIGEFPHNKFYDTVREWYYR